MKFDSFSRFLKSELYKDSLVAEMSGKSLPFENSEKEPLLDIGEGFHSTHSSLRKTNEGSRRRSILPSFGLRKDRSKSKDRDASLENPKKGKKNKNHDQYHSMTSLTSQNTEIHQEVLDTTNESTEDSNCALARVILPDKATTVVQTRTGESIRSMVARLLEKRALRYTSFDVFVTNSEKPLDLGEDSTTLGNYRILKFYVLENPSIFALSQFCKKIIKLGCFSWNI